MSEELQTRQTRYLLGVHLGRRFLFRRLIDDKDYERLESRFAEKFCPLVRCKTSLLDTHPLIRRRRRT